MSALELLACIRHQLPSIRVIAMNGEFSDNRAPPEVEADAIYEKGAMPLLRIKTVDAMSRHLRSPFCLSTEDLIEYRILESV